MMRALGAVVLAAGASERFGAANKLLVSVDSSPMIRRLVMQIIMSDAAEVVVVTGYDEANVTAAVEGLAIRCLHNESWQSGMGTSIAIGVAALSAEIDGAFVVPGDMPRLTWGVLVRLASAFDESGGQAAVFPVTASGDQRNPVLWPRRYFRRLTNLSGHEGAKKLLNLPQIERSAVLIDGTACLEDIDTPEDLQRMHHLRQI